MKTLKHKICDVDDIDEGKSRSFKVGETSLFVVRQNSEFFAYENACPHLGVELEWSENEFLNPGGDLIQCNLHGALFTIEEGHCISGPCAGQQLTTIAIEQQGQALFVTLKK